MRVSKVAAFVVINLLHRFGANRIRYAPAQQGRLADLLMKMMAVALAMIATPAMAETYTFDAGDAFGTFRTGATSINDPTYYVLENFTFDTLTIPSQTLSNVSANTFYDGAAYSPTVNQFRNFYLGNQYNDTGGFDSDDGSVSFFPVRVGSQVTGFSSASFESFSSSAPFSVTGQVVAAAPEPATWAMMIGGFGIVGRAMRRRQSEVKTRVAFA